MNSRRPKAYVPPYNYCDRLCERCAIDRSKCLLYQMEMDDRLHREIDGLSEPSPREKVDRLLKDTRLAIQRVEDQARRMGMDPGGAAREAAAEARTPPPRPSILGEAVLLARGLSSFLRDHGRDFPEETAFLRRTLTMPGAKLARACEIRLDGDERADAILQAQVAHRLLGEAAAALESIRRRRPSLGDPMLDLLRLVQSLRREIGERWLSLPCDALEPAPPGEWWGPLRDITPVLRTFRG